MAKNRAPTEGAREGRGKRERRVEGGCGDKKKRGYWNERKQGRKKRKRVVKKMKCLSDRVRE